MSLPRSRDIQRAIPSRLRGRMSPKTQRIVSLGATLALIAGYALAVSNTDGIERAELSLDDGGVYVTNQKQMMLGHVNYFSQSLDASESVVSNVFDIFQEEDTVLSHDVTNRTIALLEPSTVVLSEPHSLGTVDQVSYGNETLALLDSSSGKLWLTDVGGINSFSSEVTKPDAQDIPGGRVNVGKDGSVHVVSAQQKLWRTYEIKGTTFHTVNHDFPAEFADSSDLQVTSVGTESVLLDAQSGQLALPGGSIVDLNDDKGLKVQEPSVAGDIVAVSSSTTFYTVNIDDGSVSLKVADPENPDNQGKAAHPVIHDGCAYAAWAGSGRYLRDCAGSDLDTSSSVQSLDQSTEARFRTNRGYIVLNDVASGNIWLPESDMKLVNNWNEVPDTENQDDDDPTDSTDITNQQEDWERTEENHPPRAEDDSYGVRPGQTTTLPVTYNDSDEDGDVLVVTPISKTNLGTIRQTRNGQALQIDVPDSATGSSYFDYEADDGRGGKDTARVSLEVHPFSQNAGPTQLTATSAKVASGRSVTLQVLGDWIDPDGDQIYLKSATADANLNVTFKETGSVTVTDLGNGPGKYEVTLLVSDGMADTRGTLTIEVTDGANIKPRANGDIVRIVVGESATVYPLDNDVDANGDQLRLAGLGALPDGISAKFSKADGSVIISSSKVGTRYLTYYVSDGPDSSMGVIRIDTVELNPDSVPVAESDIAMLPAGGQVLVDVLANDTDPGGGVLILQSAQTAENSRLVVTPVNHQFVRVSAPSGLDSAEVFNYTITNGSASATGQVKVIPVAAEDAAAPPITADDSLVVRAGDVGTVSVLDNDRSPGNLTLTVLPTFTDDVGPDEGETFISDNKVRFRAGNVPGNYRIIYTVRDSLGNTASGTVNVTVTELNEDTNNPPIPKNITVRTVVNQPVTVRVDLNGIDPEGDSVELVGITSAPQLGVAKVDGSTIVYTPSKAGRDSFEYTVRDSFGKHASARIRVGVAPAPTENQPPVAVRDSVSVRPGTRVSVPVIDNDSDPEGHELSLVKGSATTAATDISIAEEGNKIVVTTPNHSGSYSVIYQVTDNHGGVSQGMLTVNVSPTAPLLAPVAVDDIVAREEVFGKSSVTVNVLANDYDPDGYIRDAEVTSEDPGVTVNADKTLTIATSDGPRIILYKVTDASGMSASAVVRVPGAIQAEPAVDTTKSITVTAGQTIEFDINDYIITRSGRSVIMTDPNLVTAPFGTNGDPLYKNETTIRLTASSDFDGPMPINLEVTDGKSLSDETGLIRRLTLQVEVKPVGNRPPVFLPTPIQVEADETATVNLAAMTTDPDKDDLPENFTYTLEGVPDGVSASIQGAVMTVKAGADTSPGRLGNISITVSDGGEKVAGQIPVAVVGTSKPLLQVSPITDGAVNAGTTQRYDLADYVVNPFEEPFTVVGQPRVVRAPSGVAVRVSGTVVTVDVPSGVNGAVNIEYDLMDATGQVNRQVRGTIELMVRDKPEAIQFTSITMGGESGTAVLQWAGMVANGAPINRVIIEDITSGNEYHQETSDPVTIWSIPERTLGIDHVFRVTVCNDVGCAPATTSQPFHMDTRPDPVRGLSLSPGDGQLMASSSPLTSSGSEITDAWYEVEGLPNRYPANIDGSAAAITGLTNGVQYTVTLHAKNRVGEAETASAQAVPYGKPVVGEISVVEGSDFGGGKYIHLNWGSIDANGNAVDSVTVECSGGACETQVFSDERTSTAVPINYSGSEVTFTVTVKNAPGSETKKTSAPLVVLSDHLTTPNPGQIQATGESGQVRITTMPTGGASGGWSQDSIRYQISFDGGRNWQAANSGQSYTAGRNGDEVTAVFRAVAERSGRTATSDSSTASAPTIPYAQPDTVSGLRCTISNGKDVTCRWNAASHNGRTGRIVFQGPGIEQNLDATATSASAPNMTPGTQATFCVTVHQDTPQSLAGERACQTVSMPQLQNGNYSFAITDELRPFEDNGFQTNGQGYLVRFRLQGYAPGETVRCQEAGDSSKYADFQVDGNGNIEWSDFKLYGGKVALADSTTADPYSLWTCQGHISR